jgi:hypothetical protein
MVPGSAHDVHAPLQRVLQHTPSAQKPVTHSESFWHAGAESGPLHEPLVQRWPAAQSASFAHASRHCPVEGSHV